MTRLLVQVEIKEKSDNNIMNTFFSNIDPIVQVRRNILTIFEQWVDEMIGRVAATVPSSPVYTAENRNFMLYDIDYSSRDEIYSFFTETLDPTSLAIIDPFIVSLIDTVYTWPQMFVSTMDSFYTSQCFFTNNFVSKKFSICYSKFKLTSNIIFTEA